MKKDGYGRIINIISTSVRIPLKNLGVSNTIRGAVASWAKTMANELGQFNITVNNILPGSTNTKRLESLIKTTQKKLKKVLDEVEKQMQDEIPMRALWRCFRTGCSGRIPCVAGCILCERRKYSGGWREDGFDIV